MTAPRHEPRPVRFALELALAAVLVGVVAHRTAARWQGAFQPLKQPAPEAYAMSPEPGERPVSADELPAPSRPKITAAGPQSSMAVVPERLPAASRRPPPAVAEPVRIEALGHAPRPVLTGVPRPGQRFPRGIELRKPEKEILPAPKAVEPPEDVDPEPAKPAETPVLFERAPIPADSLALARDKAVLPEPERRFDPVLAFAAVALVFLLAYSLLAGALRRGPGGRGFTHD